MKLIRYDELLALEICKKTPPIALKGSMDEDENEVRIDGLNEKIHKTSLDMIGQFALHQLLFERCCLH